MKLRFSFMHKKLNIYMKIPLNIHDSGGFVCSPLHKKDEIKMKISPSYIDKIALFLYSKNRPNNARG